MHEISRSSSRMQLSRHLCSHSVLTSIPAAKQLHARLILSNDADPRLLTNLLHLYANDASTLPFADALLLRHPDAPTDIFLWNTLVRAHALLAFPGSALSLFRSLPLPPNAFTFPFALRAAASLSHLPSGRLIHAKTIKSSLSTNVFVAAGLVDMYAKCGRVVDARKVFDGIVDRDVVVWNSMVAAYARNGMPEEAIRLFGELVEEGFYPTVASVVTVVAAAAGSPVGLMKGREIHGFCWRRGFGREDRVRTAFLDMYAKSGLVAVARKLFDGVKVGRLISWNAMINGYAMHGHANEALVLFGRMVEEGDVRPDHITFVGVLSACSNGGLVEEGRRFFEIMWREYKVEPKIQHYTCMIDLLGHSGQLKEAYGLVKEMPMRPDSGVWGALLDACKIHRDVELGELALQRLIELEPHDAGNYVLLSNIYAQVGKWDEAARIRKVMTDMGLKKSIACSWIEVKNGVHGFLVGDLSHPLSDEIYAELDRLEGLMVELGYVADTRPVFHNVDDDEKRNMVRSHSERLAVAFGLISTPPRTKLLVTKNLKICEDCHVAIELISRITEREIIVRDVNRYHNFKDGKCSCGGYW